MTPIAQEHLIQSVADALQFISYFHPADYITVHHILLRPEVLVIEGLRGLEQLRGEQVVLCALPLRVRGRDGSPCRAMAIDADSAAELKPLAEIFAGLQF